MWQIYFGNFVNFRIKTGFKNLKGISLRVIFIMVLRLPVISVRRETVLAKVGGKVSLVVN